MRVSFTHLLISLHGIMLEGLRYVSFRKDIVMNIWPAKPANTLLDSSCFTLKSTIPSLCLSPHSFSSVSLFMCKDVLDRGGGRERKSERMSMCFPQRLYHVYMYRVHQRTTSTRVWQGRIIINPLCTLYQLVQKLHTSSVSTRCFPLGNCEVYRCLLLCLVFAYIMDNLDSRCQDYILSTSLIEPSIQTQEVEFQFPILGSRIINFVEACSLYSVRIRIIIYTHKLLQKSK